MKGASSLFCFLSLWIDVAQLWPLLCIFHTGWSFVTAFVSSPQNLTLWRRSPAPSILAACVSAAQGCSVKPLLITPARAASSTLFASLGLESKSEVGIPPVQLTFSNLHHGPGPGAFGLVGPQSLFLFRHLDKWCYLWRVPFWDLLWSKLQHRHLQAPHKVSPQFFKVTNKLIEVNKG